LTRSGNARYAQALGVDLKLLVEEPREPESRA